MHAITHPATTLAQVLTAVVTFVSLVDTFSDLRGLFKLFDIAVFRSTTATILIRTCPLSEKVGDVVGFGW